VKQPKSVKSRDLHSAALRNEAEVVDRVMRNAERFEIDIADAEVLAGLDRDRSIFQ
jgi:hypothetical protein